MNNNEQPRGRPRAEDLWLLARLIVLVAIAWLVFGFVPFLFLPRPLSLGDFGDSFGFVNALFSGLALAGVIYAIILQRRELSLQREDLALTRRELHRSAEAQERSENALEEQAKAMLMVARLNAINSMARMYSEKIALCDRDDHLKRAKLERRFEMYREQLEILLDGMQPTPFHRLLEYFGLFLDNFELEWNGKDGEWYDPREKLALINEAHSELATFRHQGGLKDTAVCGAIDEGLRRLDALRLRACRDNGRTPVEDVIREGNEIIALLKQYRPQSWE
ncbi:MAG TPA: hypothetical protein VG406_11255 [Isosphaeraceae bacterium]|jgi:hypothetical protein|nr:hypothetical protein [Isosphaeraceae bacterium]